MPTRVVWYGDKVRREVQDDINRALTAVALQIEAQAKVEITNNRQIDTGFLRNTGYTIAPERNTFNEVDASGQYTSRRTGQTVRRERVPAPVTPEKGEAIVGFAADYAVYQELRNSFLFRAAERVRGQDAENAIARVAPRGFPR